MMDKKAETIDRIRKDGLIPLFFHPDPGVCLSVASAVFGSGCHSIEFTNRGAGALEAFRALVAHARGNHPDGRVGAGTINDANAAGQFLDAGADFIVGPGFDEDVARLCASAGIPYIPGCATVTEIIRASRSGSELIKLFPADALGGPAFLRAIRGPLPWLHAVATGGVKATEESIAEWFSAGAAAVGLGSDLIGKDMIDRADFDGLRRRLENLLAVAARVRGIATSK